MKEILLARRYVKAFLGNVRPQDYEKLHNDINLLQNFLNNNSDTIKLLDSMLYPLTFRQKFVREISKILELASLWENLFQILINRHKFGLIDEILDEMEKALFRIQNMIKVTLKTAREHTPETIENIRNMIENRLNCKVIFRQVLDPEVVGGFVAETESMLIDGSVRSILLEFVNFCKIKE
ncbi:MAG: ATP synthase F1 subunit delta [Candidatus Cloacimonetes bacterium]|nr:ATP synthase F1 subunit delta [Candidatus Cloacimonadota bacterium]